MQGDIRTLRKALNAKVVDVILAKGGNPSSKNKAGATALDIAKGRKRTKLVPLLAAG